MTTVSSVVDSVNLTADDVTSNQQGLISAGQRRMLLYRRIAWIGGTCGFMLVLSVLCVVGVVKLTIPAFAQRGELFVWVPVGLFWLWLLRSAALRWLQTNRELRMGFVATLEGRVQTEVSFSVGLIQIAKYRIRINEHIFRVSKPIFFQFKNREYYRVYYAPASKTLLGAVQLAPAHTAFLQPGALLTPHDASAGTSTDAMPTHSQPLLQPVPLPDRDELIEPLTRHEREILRLIASGLSNKEIAAELSLSVNTIKMYTSQLYRKLDVRRRTEAVARARDLHLL